MPCLPVYDWGLRVLENSPLLFWAVYMVLVFVAFLVSAEICCVAHILGFTEDALYRSAMPVILVVRISHLIPISEGDICRRAEMIFFVSERPRYLERAFPVNRHPEDTLYNARRYVINQPFIFVIGRFDVTIQR